MKHQKIKKAKKNRTFFYFSGRILIRSEIKLTKQQRKEIFKIIRINIHYSPKAYAFYTARRISHTLKNEVSSVSVLANALFYIIKISI